MIDICTWRGSNGRKVTIGPEEMALNRVRLACRPAVPRGGGPLSPAAHSTKGAPA